MIFGIVHPLKIPCIVGGRYDFASAGSGEFTFTPNLLLYAVNLESLVDGNANRINTVVPETAIQYQPITIDIDISRVDSVNVLDKSTGLEKRATTRCTDKGKAYIIDERYT